MEHNAIFQEISRLNDDYVRFWRDICELESPTKDKAGVDVVARFCAREAQMHGWDVIWHKEDVSGDALCIVMNPDAPGKSVCFSGHMDTVHPIGLFTKPAVRIEGDTVYGPGVSDCKGGIAGAFLAMAALQAIGFRDRPVKLILQSDEETGSAGSNKGTVDFMARMAEGCAAFLNGEPHPRGKLILRRKGISKYRIDITGRAQHAGTCYDGVSAIAEAAKIILELEKYKDKDGITMNCGIISGGTAINTVPEKCTLFVDTRFVSEAQRLEIDQTIRAFEKKPFHPEAKCVVTLESYRVAMEACDETNALFDALNRIYTAAGMPELIATGSNGGSDAADMVSRGITAIDGFGVTGTKFHNVGENAELHSLEESARRYALAALYL